MCLWWQAVEIMAARRYSEEECRSLVAQMQVSLLGMQFLLPGPRDKPRDYSHSRACALLDKTSVPDAACLYKALHAAARAQLPAMQRGDASGCVLRLAARSDPCRNQAAAHAGPAQKFQS